MPRPSVNARIAPIGEAVLLEIIMLLYIFHSRSLDWVRPDELRDAAFEAVAILNDSRMADDMPESWRRFLAGESIVL
jgi:hypothetical protein